MSRLDKQYYDTIRDLKKKCPTKHPVVVRRVDPKLFKSEPGKIADAGFDEATEVFTIRISRDESMDSAIDVLVHEWAHILLWDYTLPEGTEGPHHAEWGVCHARCYRAVFED